jgi:hypothetical protein
MTERRAVESKLNQTQPGFFINKRFSLPRVNKESTFKRNLKTIQT